jgi:hypothetical protein
MHPSPPGHLVDHPPVAIREGCSVKSEHWETGFISMTSDLYGSTIRKPSLEVAHIFSFPPVRRFSLPN